MRSHLEKTGQFLFLAGRGGGWLERGIQGILKWSWCRNSEEKLFYANFIVVLFQRTSLPLFLGLSGLNGSPPRDSSLPTFLPPTSGALSLLLLSIFLSQFLSNHLNSVLLKFIMYKSFFSNNSLLTKSCNSEYLKLTLDHFFIIFLQIDYLPKDIFHQEIPLKAVFQYSILMHIYGI